MIGMNVSVPTIPDMNSIQQLNTKPDFNTRDINSGDHREFNSLIDKHGSEHIHKKSTPAEKPERAKHQGDTLTTKETVRSSEQHDNTEIDNSDQSGESAENGKSGSQSVSYEEAASKSEGNDLAGIRRYSEQSESGLSMEALLSLLNVKVPVEGIDPIINNAAAGNIEQPVIPDAADSGTGNEEETDALLLNVLQQAVEAINNSLRDTISENAAQESAGTEAAAGSENSLEKGTALLNLLQKAIAAASDTPSINGETTGDAEQAANGMSAGDKVQKIESLLSGLLNKDDNQIPDSALPDSEASDVRADNLAAKEKTAGKGDAKSDAFNDIAKMLNEVKTARVEEKLSTEQIRALHAASGQTKEAKEGNSIGSGKNANHTRDEIKIPEAPENVSEIDLPENTGDPRTIVNRAASEISEHISRDGNAGASVSKSGRTVKLNPEGSNTNMLHNSHATGEGGRSSESILTGGAARQAGFNELLDKAVYVVKGNNRLNVSVEHQDMGKIDIKLILEKGVMNIHINTSDNAVREYVASNIQSIVDSLSKNGVSVGGFSVALKNHQDGGDGGSGNDSGYAINSGREKEYIKAPVHVNENRGLVNIFA